MEAAAVAGSYASVIGGAPAAAVVFAREVSVRTDNDPRVAGIRARLAADPVGPHAELRHKLADAGRVVRAETLRQVADEFDSVHDIRRALRVGSVDTSSRPLSCGRSSSGRSSGGWPPGRLDLVGAGALVSGPG